jgi:hypothetical protein
MCLWIGEKSEKSVSTDGGYYPRCDVPVVYAQMRTARSVWEMCNWGNAARAVTCARGRGVWTRGVISTLSNYAGVPLRARRDVTPKPCLTELKHFESGARSYWAVLRLMLHTRPWVTGGRGVDVTSGLGKLSKSNKKGSIIGKICLIFAKISKYLIRFDGLTWSIYND